MNSNSISYNLSLPMLCVKSLKFTLTKSAYLRLDMFPPIRQPNKTDYHYYNFDCFI